MRLNPAIAAAAAAAVCAVSQTAHAQALHAKIEIGDPGPEGVRINAEGVFANYFPGKGKGPHRPAVLFIGGSEGGLHAGGGGAIGSLAAAGFDVLYVCYFGCPGTPDQLAEAPLETFDRALAWLASRPGANRRRIALVGGSKGAEAALLVATRHPELKAVVAGMPSSVVWPGVGRSSPPAASWTEGGKPLPALPYAYSAFAKGGIFALYDEALASERDHPDAVIPVERIAAPLMLVCGEADKLWPSCRMSEEIAARLAAHGRPAPLVLRYAQAGHAVLGAPTPPSAQLASLGGTPEGNAAARADGWPKVLAFLAAQLR